MVNFILLDLTFHSFHTAQASVRRTGTEWQYQIVISRVFDEGEEGLLNEEEESMINLIFFFLDTIWIEIYWF